MIPRRTCTGPVLGMAETANSAPFGAGVTAQTTRRATPGPADDVLTTCRRRANPALGSPLWLTLRREEHKPRGRRHLISRPPVDPALAVLAREARRASSSSTTRASTGQDLPQPRRPPSARPRLAPERDRCFVDADRTGSGGSRRARWAPRACLLPGENTAGARTPARAGSHTRCPGSDVKPRRAAAAHSPDPGARDLGPARRECRHHAPAIARTPRPPRGRAHPRPGDRRIRLPALLLAEALEQAGAHVRFSADDPLGRSRSATRSRPRSRSATIMASASPELPLQRHARALRSPSSSGVETGRAALDPALVRGARGRRSSRTESFSHEPPHGFRRPRRHAVPDPAQVPARRAATSISRSRRKATNGAHSMMTRPAEGAGRLA